jgi:hypothetical protein
MISRQALLWLAPLVLAGCADIAVPRLLHPGSEEYQQTRAERFDPYPLPDWGPEIVGGRPLQYIKPAPWAERVQDDLTFVERFGQAAPPGLYKPPRASTARQAVVYPLPGAQPLAVPPLTVPPPGAQPVVPLPQGAAPPLVPQEARNWHPAG